MQTRKQRGRRRPSLSRFRGEYSPLVCVCAPIDKQSTVCREKRDRQISARLESKSVRALDEVRDHADNRVSGKWHSATAFPHNGHATSSSSRDSPTLGTCTGETPLHWQIGIRIQARGSVASGLAGSSARAFELAIDSHQLSLIGTSDEGYSISTGERANTRGQPQLIGIINWLDNVAVCRGVAVKLAKKAPFARAEIYERVRANRGKGRRRQLAAGE